jgi:predicted Fe-Mo cluster-binding NifX family protein
MKIALPEWNDHISPVFDVADNILIYEYRNGEKEKHEIVSLPVAGPLMRASILKAHGVAIVICGAISRLAENALFMKNIQTISYKCGQITEILSAFRNGHLEDAVFSMPGCQGKENE